ncbi:class III lanthipeptide [Streptomyces sp. NPDC090798]|uniref:class III lanthipeptide n=1 Tax=Streptomyces sp. NPDC090798 TaxID=3365968 RepID=UPI0038041042
MSESTPDLGDLSARLAQIEAVLGLQRLRVRAENADFAGASHQSRSCGGASGLSLGCHCIEEAMKEAPTE